MGQQQLVFHLEGKPATYLQRAKKVRVRCLPTGFRNPRGDLCCSTAERSDQAERFCSRELLRLAVDRQRHGMCFVPHIEFSKVLHGMVRLET